MKKIIKKGKGGIHYAAMARNKIAIKFLLENNVFVDSRERLLVCFLFILLIYLILLLFFYFIYLFILF